MRNYVLSRPVIPELSTRWRFALVWTPHKPAFCWVRWGRWPKGRSENQEALSADYPLAPQWVYAVPFPSTFKVSACETAIQA